MRRLLISLVVCLTLYLAWDALGRFTWQDINEWRAGFLSDAAPVDLQQAEEGQLELRRRELDLNEGLDLSDLPAYSTQPVEVMVGGVGRDIRLERGGQEVAEYYQERMEEHATDSSTELYRVPEGSMEGMDVEGGR